MKSDILFDAIGELPDEYVQDARPATVLKRKVPWGVWAAAAACLVVAVLIVMPYFKEGWSANRADFALAEAEAESNDGSINAEEKATETTSGSTAPEGVAAEGAIAEGAEPVMYGDDADVPASESGELPAGAATEEEFEQYSLALFTTLFGDGEYTYEQYLGGYKRAIENPVFEALLNGGGTERFFAASASADNLTQWASIYVDGLSTVGKSLSVHIEHSDVYFEQEWKYFDGTGDREVEVTDYEVDGIEIQKYYMADIYFARINIDGDWYLVTGYDEAAVDKTMAELARIANRL